MDLLVRLTKDLAVRRSERKQIISRLRTGQFPRKTGEMSEMLSALNDKRSAPRINSTKRLPLSGKLSAGAKRLMTEEDRFNNAYILVKKSCV